MKPNTKANEPDATGRWSREQSPPLPERLKSEVCYHFNSDKAVKAAGKVIDADLEIINSKFAVRPLAADEIWGIEVWLANDAIDRDGEKFSGPTLARLAETIVGKSFLMAHQWGPPGEARFYDARVMRAADGVSWLVGKIYTLRKGHETLIDNIESGVWWAVSIGFRWTKIVPVSKTGADMSRDDAWDHPDDIAYWEFREDVERGEQQSEALEGSLVYLGAQIGASMARVSKAFGGSTIRADWYKTFVSGGNVDGNEPSNPGDKAPPEPPDTTNTNSGKEHTMKTVTMKDASGVKFCPECGKALTDKDGGKFCAACDTHFVSETKAPAAVTPDPAQTATLAPGADINALLMKLTEGTIKNQQDSAGLAALVQTQATQIKEMTEKFNGLVGRLDQVPNRKGMAMEPDAEGFIKIPVEIGSAMGLKSEAEIAKVFKLDVKTGRPSANSLKAFADMHGLKFPNVTKEMNKPDTKENVKEALTLLLTEAFDRELWR